ncbi:MarR family transcriptional regulator [Paenibacillus sp. Marseille-Q4541]|uniref:MarR family winged helix-turn-helix transcriptional regulator n=1 Tax=Paenibacillus sp. Marseille-Q4541 TaxID=2831522 RepID=UPI001BAA17D1|nr:MarR family transcriptional regulator [Paenibacillus sp. Marseille-Q4541]
MNNSVPERSIGFMLGVAHRRSVHLMNQRLKEYDITTEQWSVLFQIFSHEGMNQREIASKAYKDQPTTTRIIDMLEKKNLVIRKPSLADRRAYELFLTDEGVALSHSILPLEEKLNEDLANSIPEEEMTIFWKVLNDIQYHLQEQHEQKNGSN